MTYFLIILSGKGGVGKSTVAAAMARSIGMLGIKTGLIDMDIDSPSIPTITGTTGNDIKIGSNLLEPAISNGIKVFSVGHLIPSEDTPILWEGAKKEKFLQDIFKSCDFRDVEFLVIDMPPGSGDELFGVSKTLQTLSAIVVTLPQQLSLISAKKVVRALKKYSIPILGIIENMSGFQCKCGETVYPFRHGAGKMLAAANGVEFLGEIPLMMNVSTEADEGRVDTMVHSDAFKKIFDKVTQRIGLSKAEEVSKPAPFTTPAPPIPEDAGTKEEEKKEGEKKEGEEERASEVKEEKKKKRRKEAGVGRITATIKEGKGKVKNLVISEDTSKEEERGEETPK